MAVFLSILILSYAISVIAFVYSCILTDSGMIFSKPYELAIIHLPVWLHKPLISCEKCVAGQIALWVYLFGMNVHYEWFTHLFLIMQSILNTAIIKTVYYKIINQAPKPLLSNKKIKKPAELL